MKIRAIGAAITASFFLLGACALADDAPAKTAQATKASPACTAANDPPLALGLVLKGSAIVPSLIPSQSPGASQRGSCVGTAQFVPSSQPFMSPYPWTSFYWTGSTAQYSIGQTFYGTL